MNVISALLLDNTGIHIDYVMYTITLQLSGGAVLGHLANTSDVVCRCKSENFPPAKLTGRIIFAHANYHFNIMLNYGICMKWSTLLISKFIAHIR